MTKSTSSKRTSRLAAGKPKKPRSDFPLFPHASGRWAKKVLGKFRYFGRVAHDPKGEAALKKWLDQKDELLAGRTPSSNVDGLTVKELANKFLNSKRLRVESGDLSPRTHADYLATCGRLVAAFGARRLVVDLTADDFERLRAAIAKTWGPVAVGNEISRVRSVFRYAYEASLVDRPVRYGPEFKRPSKRVLRLARASKGPRLFEAAQLRRMIEQAEVPLKAMLLLAINCGFGNSDCGNLELRHMDLHRGWINYPRPKTGIDRRCHLWPETIAAIRATLEARPTPKDKSHEGLVFVTRVGGSWAKGIADSPITKETTKLLDELQIRRPGLSFYAIRHTFQTIGDECLDQACVSAVMGHAPNSNDMASVYREGVSDDRLRAVSNHVRGWLWPRRAVKAKKK